MSDVSEQPTMTLSQNPLQWWNAQKKFHAVLAAFCIPVLLFIIAVFCAGRNESTRLALAIGVTGALAGAIRDLFLSSGFTRAFRFNPKTETGQMWDSGTFGTVVAGAIGAFLFLGLFGILTGKDLVIVGQTNQAGVLAASEIALAFVFGLLSAHISAIHRDVRKYRDLALGAMINHIEGGPVPTQAQIDALK